MTHLFIFSCLVVAVVELRADDAQLTHAADMISRFVEGLSLGELQAGAITTALNEYTLAFEDVDGDAIVAAIASKVSDYIRPRAAMVLKMKELIQNTADKYDPAKMDFERLGCTSLSSATLEWTSRDRESAQFREPLRFDPQPGFNNLRVSDTVRTLKTPSTCQHH
jgi:hypothetical protein